MFCSRNVSMNAFLTSWGAITKSVVPAKLWLGAYNRMQPKADLTLNPDLTPNHSDAALP